MLVRKPIYTNDVIRKSIKMLEWQFLKSYLFVVKKNSL